MSEENAEIVRRAYEDFEQGGASAILELVAPEFELELHPPTPVIHHRGPAALTDFFGEWDQVFDSYSLSPERFIDNGDEVVVLARFHARGKGSHVPVDVPVGHRWTLRQGKAVRGIFYTDQKEALEAAGLQK